MSFILSVSGSTVLSASDQLWQLFTWGAQAVEAGFFRSQSDIDYILGECVKNNMPFALHSPLCSNGDRYGLLFGEETAWQELDRDLALAK